jgi:hypothetical protein
MALSMALLMALSMVVCYFPVSRRENGRLALNVP